MSRVDRRRGHEHAAGIDSLGHIDLAVPDARHDIECGCNVDVGVQSEIRIAYLDVAVAYVNVVRR